MPEESYLKNIIYKNMKNSDYDIYYCSIIYNYKDSGFRNKCTKELADQLKCYGCAFFNTKNGAPNFGDTSVNHNGNSFKKMYFVDGKIISFSNDTLAISLLYPSSIIYDNFINYNHTFRTNYAINDITKTYADLLLDTDYYKMKKLDELKTSIGSSSGGGSSSVNVDMTTTNNLLYTILIAICVIIVYFSLKKLFFRGV